VDMYPENQAWFQDTLWSAQG